MRLGEYETHPIADAFPLLEGARWERFLEKLKRFGVVNLDLWRYEGKLLDGRNRYRGILELGLKAKIKWHDFDGELADAIDFASAMNLEGRRNMSPSVCTLAACKLYELVKPKGRGRPRKDRTGTEITKAELARREGISVSQMEDGQVVLEKCAPEVVASINREDLTISEALELAQLPHDEQRAALERRAAEATTRAKRAALRGKPQNDNELAPAAAANQLVRVMVKGIEQLGATVQSVKGTDVDVRFELLIAYAGNVFAVSLQRNLEQVA
jgi:hypothetical protein